MIGPRTWGFPKQWLSPEIIQQQRLQPPPKRPDSMGERGVVLCPNWRVPGLELPADLALLRRLLLYWDAIVWPQFAVLDVEAAGEAEMQRLISLERIHDPRLAFLDAEGVLDMARTLVAPLGPGVRPPTEQEVGAAQWGWQRSVYATADFHEPGQWAIAREGTDFRGPDHNVDGALGSLTNLLPEPAPDVPFHEILAFRRKTREALETFRLYLDELAIPMQQDPGSALIYNHAHARLEKAIAEIWVKAREQDFKAQQMTAGSLMTMVGSAALATLSAPSLASMLHYSLAEAALAAAMLGAAVGAVAKPGGFTLSRAKLAKLTDTPNYAAYFLTAASEGIIQGAATPVRGQAPSE